MTQKCHDPNCDGFSSAPVNLDSTDGGTAVGRIDSSIDKVLDSEDDAYLLEAYEAFEASSMYMQVNRSHNK